VLLGLSMIDMNAEGGNINSMWSVHLTSVYWRGSTGCTIPLHFQYVRNEEHCHGNVVAVTSKVELGDDVVGGGIIVQSARIA
jgi:hypothetical protein